MVSAGVSNLSRLENALKKEQKKESFRICNDFHDFGIKRQSHKFFKFFLIILLILFVVEVIMVLWIWQMPTDRYNRFTACLDVGTVSSLKERMIYYMACLMGSLGG